MVKKKRAGTKPRQVKVNPKVWATAKRLAKGDMKRIEVVNRDEVIVH